MSLSIPQLPGKKVARILSIDGGGIRGLVPATLIAGWEKQLGGPIGNYFHMVAGTSTGGILACALTKPSPVSGGDLMTMYQKRGGEIFAGDWTSIGGVAGELYDATGLEKVLTDTLTTTKLSDAKNDLLVTTYDIEKRVPYLFKSWKARGYELETGAKPTQFDFVMKDVSRATSAAPTYFKPAKIKSVSGQEMAVVDGGVFANNPAMCAYVAARRIYPNADEYLIVSVGTGGMVHPYKYEDAVNWGLVGWARPLLDILFDGASAVTEYELSQLSQVTQFRFQTSLEGASEAMDDVTPENLANLVKVAQANATKLAPQMTQMVARLKEPMTTADKLGYPARTTVPKPGLQVVSQAVVKPKATTTAAAIGATAGLVTLGPPGAIAGGGLGYLFGKIQEIFS